MILHHEFIKTAKKYSKKLAIIDRTTGKRVTYSRALIGALLLSKKIKKIKGGYVGIMIPNTAGSYLAILGVLMAGKVPVMINYSTNAYDNCIYGQNKCGFGTILTSRSFLEKIKCPLLPEMVFLEDLAEMGTGKKIVGALKSKAPAKAIINSLPKASTEDTIIILFTSGSEKEPKAVELCHRNIGSNLTGIVDVVHLSEKDVILGNLPLFHVFGLTVNFWLPMVMGMTAVTVANPLDFKNIPKICKEEKVTLIAATPAFFLGYGKASKPGDFESVRLLIPGADKTPLSLFDMYREKHNLPLYEGYGCTETSPVISVNTPDNNKQGSIGQPLPGVQVKIADIVTGDSLPANGEGKILVKGDLVMKGYFDDIEETSFRIHDGWYDTGDMGKLDEDGFLWHLGRLKRFTKIGGEMVSLVKIENSIYDHLPSEVDCCVVEVPDVNKGAKIVAVTTVKIDEKDLRKKLSSQLPNIAIPKQFMVMEDLPKMGSGKVDFRTITQMVRDQLLSDTK